MGPPRRSPQDEEAEHDTYIRAHMKEAVPEGIDLKILHTVGGISSTGEHVVPLQHLMEQNPIKESSQAQAKEETGGDRKVFLMTVIVVHGKTPAYSGHMRALRPKEPALLVVVPTLTGAWFSAKP